MGMASMAACIFTKPGIYKNSSILLGKFDHDLAVLPSPGIMAFIGKSSPNRWPNSSGE